MSTSRRKRVAATGEDMATADISGLGGVADAAPPVAPSGSSASAAGPPAMANSNALSGAATSRQTVVPGGANDGGYRTLIVRAGEPYTVRSMGVSNTPVMDRALAAFAHMSDLHIVDDQSPLRVEFLDRLADGHAPGYDTASAYRPHEVLSTHLTDAMCRSLRNIARGPRTDLPLAFTIVTGDAVDNCQYNETRWYMDLLDGGHMIRADSGQIGVEESVSYFFGPGELDLFDRNHHESAYWF